MRDSIGYITIGLFSNILLDELLKAEKDPDVVPKESKMIQILIDSLEECKNPGSIGQKKYQDFVFQKYQEEKTLRGALGLSDYCSKDIYLKKMNGIIYIFDKIIDPCINPQERYGYIKRVIEFSSRLCKRAVFNAEFAHPDNYVPLGVIDVIKNQNKTKRS